MIFPWSYLLADPTVLYSVMVWAIKRAGNMWLSWTHPTDHRAYSGQLQFRTGSIQGSISSGSDWFKTVTVQNGSIQGCNRAKTAQVCSSSGSDRFRAATVQNGPIQGSNRAITAQVCSSSGSDRSRAATVQKWLRGSSSRTGTKKRFFKGIFKRDKIYKRRK